MDDDYRYCNVCNGPADNDDISFTCSPVGPQLICRHCAVTLPLCDDATCAPQYRCVKPEYDLLNAMDEQLERALQRWQDEIAYGEGDED